MLRGLSKNETVNAVGIAGSFAAGNLEYLAQETLSKRIQPGVAAQAGVTAVVLAAKGYTGPKTILEGENGFLHAYADGGDGSTHQATLQTCRGDPDNPLTDEEIYDALAGRFLSDADAAALADIVDNLTDVEDVTEITRYLRG